MDGSCPSCYNKMEFLTQFVQSELEGVNPTFIFYGDSVNMRYNLSKIDISKHHILLDKHNEFAQKNPNTIQKNDILLSTWDYRIIQYGDPTIDKTVATQYREIIKCFNR